jgi:formylglycine-generating enzyme required for sulfatase activity
MSADVAAKLRLLAQDYQDGRLDLAAYRALRAPLLDSLVLNVYSVKAAMEVTQPRAAARPMDHEVTQPGKPLAQPRAQSNLQSAVSGARPENNPPSKKLHAGTVAGAIFVLAAVIIATMVWRGRSLGQTGSEGSRESAEFVDSAAGSDAAGVEAVRRLIDEFIDRGDWSESRLTPLNAALLELGGARMAAAAREAWFQRFVDELRRRLKEQQALAPATLTADNSPLAALAVTVGFDLKSPDAAIHIASLPPPSAPQIHAGPTRAEAGKTIARGENEKSSPVPVVAAASAPVAPPVAVAASAPTASVGNAQDTCRIDLIRSRRPLCQDSLPGGTEGPLMAMVPAGVFDMGGAAASDEQPVHRVTIREPFAISVHEVSQGEFKHFCEHTRHTCAQQPWAGDDYPAVNVSWDDARAYAEWLSSATHRRYSLPTEAQWEYAARAGQAGPFPGGDSLSATDAHYSMLAKQATAARRSQKFNANAFRLVHTVGNVREWVEDAWAPGFAGASTDGSAMKSAHGAMRVARGGSYADGAARLRLSMREGLPVNTRDSTTGFRIVRELPKGGE